MPDRDLAAERTLSPRRSAIERERARIWPTKADLILHHAHALASLRAIWLSRRRLQDRNTELEQQVQKLRVLAGEWATQPTDYDEDTEQQIDDGRTVLAILGDRPKVSDR